MIILHTLKNKSTMGGCFGSDHSHPKLRLCMKSTLQKIIFWKWNRTMIELRKCLSNFNVLLSCCLPLAKSCLLKHVKQQQTIIKLKTTNNKCVIASTCAKVSFEFKDNHFVKIGRNYYRITPALKDKILFLINPALNIFRKNLIFMF